MPTNLLSPEYGLSNSKLEECTATASDVMNGKTFYSGDKNKKTGTFRFNGTAEPGDVAEGKTFYNYNQSLITGTLPDRNTVGKNGCVGINENYSGVAFSYGSVPQVTTLLNGARAFAIMVPWGWYNGGTYLGMLQADIASAIGLDASHLVSWVNILGIQGTNRGYDAGWTDGINNSKIYRESGWVFQVRDDPNLKGRPFKVRVQTNGNAQPSISLGFDNGTIINL